MNTRQARTEATALMAQWGLKGWKFDFDRAVRRAGRCTYGTRTITLSHQLTQIHPDDVVRNTILHEIAHALAGSSAGHGPVWKEMARRVGARPERCYDNSDLPKLPAPWEAVCADCGFTHQRFRKPTKASSCGRCCTRFNPNKTLQWKLNGRPAYLVFK